jgi:ADP-heptose:LPS heptosyltransferase
MNRDRILVFRPDNIGDVILFSGALKAIRELYPTAHITLALQKHIVNLMEHCPYIDACVPANNLTWRERLRNWNSKIPRPKKTVNLLNKKWNELFAPFDKIIFPVKSQQTRHLDIIRTLGANEVIGMIGCKVNAPPGGYPKELRPEVLFSDCFDVSKYDPWRHEILTTLDFLRFLGCRVNTTNDIQPLFWLSGSETDHLADARTYDRPIIGIFPGASSQGRCWDPENYVALVKLLGGGVFYAIFGGAQDKDLVHRVELAIRKAGENVNIINLVGKTTLRELAKCVSSCNLFFAMETSGMHMAITAGVPTVGIVGGGHYGRFAPWGDPERNIFLTKTMNCFHCNWVCERQHVDCVQGVSPFEVAEALKNLIFSESISFRRAGSVEHTDR